MSISTHVLDTALGRPADGILVVAEQRAGDGWREVGRGTTDADGRVASLADTTTAGPHRLTFATAAWFDRDGRATFWTDITVAFAVADPSAHHHVPVLLSPWGYTTYRGS